MAESAALLVDEVLLEQPMRLWVLSFPYPLRFLFASRPAVMTGVLDIVSRAIATHLIHKAGYTRKTAGTGAVTLIQRSGRTSYEIFIFTCCSWTVSTSKGVSARFHRVNESATAELTRLVHTKAHRVGGYLER